MPCSSFAWTDAVRWLRDAGHDLRLVPQNEWLELLSREAPGTANPSSPLMSYLTTGSHDAAAAHATTTARSFDRRNAERGLAGKVTCPPVDGVALQRVLEYLRRRGMLAPVPHSLGSLPEDVLLTAADKATTQNASPAGPVSARG